MALGSANHDLPGCLWPAWRFCPRRCQPRGWLLEAHGPGPGVMFAFCRGKTRRGRFHRPGGLYFGYAARRAAGQSGRRLSRFAAIGRGKLIIWQRLDRRARANGLGVMGELQQAGISFVIAAPRRMTPGQAFAAEGCRGAQFCRRGCGLLGLISVDPEAIHRAFQRGPGTGAPRKTAALCESAPPLS